MRGISWLAANQLASQEGLCTVEYVSKEVSADVGTAEYNNGQTSEWWQDISTHHPPRPVASVYDSALWGVDTILQERAELS